MSYSPPGFLLRCLFFLLAFSFLYKKTVALVSKASEIPVDLIAVSSNQEHKRQEEYREEGREKKRRREDGGFQHFKAF